MNRALRAIIFLLLPALAGCGGRGEPPLKGAAIGGPFTLTDQNGRQVSDRDFAGKYRIVYFGYTHCPDICPTDLLTLSQALARLRKDEPSEAAKVRPIFITIDPARDTPAVMKAYLSSFDPSITGLSGTPQQTARVAKEYIAFYSKGPVQPRGGYAMAHSRQMVLMGPDGAPLALVPADRNADAVVDTLEAWVR